MKRLLKKAGQGTLEYILIAAAVLALVGLLVKAVNPKAKERINHIEQEMANPG
jgi:hypothetical protein